MKLKYRVIETTLLKDLIEEVSMAIQDGWSVQGGVSAQPGRFYQALIKEDKAGMEQFK